jgi:hypothetical protein
MTLVCCSWVDMGECVSLWWSLQLYVSAGVCVHCTCYLAHESMNMIRVECLSIIKHQTMCVCIIMHMHAYDMQIWWWLCVCIHADPQLVSDAAAIDTPMICHYAAIDCSSFGSRMTMIRAGFVMLLIFMCMHHVCDDVAASSTWPPQLHADASGPPTAVQISLACTVLLSLNRLRNE